MAENSLDFSVNAILTPNSIAGIRDGVSNALTGLTISVDTAKLSKQISSAISSAGKISIDFDRAKILNQAKNIYADVQKIFSQPISINATNGTGSSKAGISISTITGNPVLGKEEIRSLNAITAARREDNKEKARADKLNREVAKSQQTFADQLSYTANKFTNYISVATLFFQAFRGISQATSDTITFNAEVNKLGQILNNNQGQAEETARAVLGIARAYGQSGKEILGVSEFLAQSGEKFSGDRLLYITRELAKTQLAATFGDIKETTQGVVAALSQFNLTAYDSTQIIDVANKLSKDFAFESGDLFTAVQSGGGAFAIANGNIKEFTATVAALRQLTRLSASTIGTGLNTIVLRSLRPEVVEFTDRLTGGAIRNADGSLKGIKDRLLEIGKVFGTLNEEQKAFLNEKLAGNRQGKLLIPLLEDIGRGEGKSVYAKALKEADEATGSTLRDSTAGLDRIDVQLRRIGTTFEEAFLNFAKDPAIKNLVKDFAYLAENIADAAKGLNEIVPLVPAIIKFGTTLTAITAFKVIKQSALTFGRTGVGIISGGPVRKNVIGDEFSGSADVRTLKSTATISAEPTIPQGTTFGRFERSPFPIGKIRKRSSVDILPVERQSSSASILNDLNNDAVEAERSLYEYHNGLDERMKEVSKRSRKINSLTRKVSSLAKPHFITPLSSEEVTKLAAERLNISEEEARRRFEKGGLSETSDEAISLRFRNTLTPDILSKGQRRFDIKQRAGILAKNPSNIDPNLLARSLISSGGLSSNELSRIFEESLTTKGSIQRPKILRTVERRIAGDNLGEIVDTPSLLRTLNSSKFQKLGGLKGSVDKIIEQAAKAQTISQIPRLTEEQYKQRLILAKADTEIGKRRIAIEQEIIAAQEQTLKAVREENIAAVNIAQGKYKQLLVEKNKLAGMSASIKTELGGAVGAIDAIKFRQLSRDAAISSASLKMGRSERFVRSVVPFGLVRSVDETLAENAGLRPSSVGGIRRFVSSINPFGPSNKPPLDEKELEKRSALRSNVLGGTIIVGSLLSDVLSDKLFGKKEAFNNDFKFSDLTSSIISSNISQETKRGAVSGLGTGLLFGSVAGQAASSGATLLGGGAAAGPIGIATALAVVAVSSFAASMAARSNEIDKSLSDLVASFSKARTETEKRRVLAEFNRVSMLENPSAIMNLAAKTNPFIPLKTSSIDIERTMKLGVFNEQLDKRPDLINEGVNDYEKRLKELLKTKSLQAAETQVQKETRERLTKSFAINEKDPVLLGQKVNEVFIKIFEQAGELADATREQTKIYKDAVRESGQVLSVFLGEISKANDRISLGFEEKKIGINAFGGFGGALEGRGGGIDINSVADIFSKITKEAVSNKINFLGSTENFSNESSTADIKIGKALESAGIKKEDVPLLKASLAFSDAASQLAPLVLRNAAAIGAEIGDNGAVVEGSARAKQNYSTQMEDIFANLKTRLNNIGLTEEQAKASETNLNAFKAATDAKQLDLKQSPEELEKSLTKAAHAADAMAIIDQAGRNKLLAFSQAIQIATDKIKLLSGITQRDVEFRQQKTGFALEKIGRIQTLRGSDVALEESRSLLGSFNLSQLIKNTGISDLVAAQNKEGEAQRNVSNIFSGQFGETSGAERFKLSEALAGKDKDKIEAAKKEFAAKVSGFEPQKIEDAIKSLVNLNNATTEVSNETDKHRLALQDLNNTLPVLNRNFEQLTQNINSQIQTSIRIGALSRPERRHIGRSVGQIENVFERANVSDAGKEILKTAGSLQDALSKLSPEDRKKIAESAKQSILSRNKGTQILQEGAGLERGTFNKSGVQVDVFSQLVQFLLGQRGVQGVSFPSLEDTTGKIKERERISQSIDQIQTENNNQLRLLNENMKRLIEIAVANLPTSTPTPNNVINPFLRTSDIGIPPLLRRPVETGNPFTPKTSPYTDFTKNFLEQTGAYLPAAPENTAIPSREPIVFPPPSIPTFTPNRFSINNGLNGSSTYVPGQEHPTNDEDARRRSGASSYVPGVTTHPTNDGQQEENARKDRQKKDLDEAMIGAGKKAAALIGDAISSALGTKTSLEATFSGDLNVQGIPQKIDERIAIASVIKFGEMIGQRLSSSTDPSTRNVASAIADAVKSISNSQKDNA